MKLRRSSRSSMVAGICAGIAHELGWAPWKVRLGYVILSLLSVAFPGILVYVILWFLMPKSDEF